MARHYSVVLTPQPEGGYTVTSPDIPDLVTEGDTREEALAMARDCAEGLVLTYLEFGDDVPASGGHAEIATIDVDVEALATRLAEERRVATSA
jgi:antitoxin HicB